MEERLGDLIWRFVDLAIYFVCEAAIFLKDIEQIYFGVRWNELWQHISEKRIARLPAEQMPEKHKLLQRLHIYTMEMLYISRGFYTSADSTADYAELAEAVRLWESSITGATEDEESNDVLTWLIKAYVSTILIQMTKLSYTDACSLHPNIQAIVTERYPFVLKYTAVSYRTIEWHKPIKYKFLSLYPAIIMLCAINEIQIFENIVQHMSTLRGFAAKGTALRVNKLITTIRQRKQDTNAICKAVAGGTCDGIHDGMDFLLQANGILGDFDIRTV